MNLFLRSVLLCLIYFSNIHAESKLELINKDIEETKEPLLKQFYVCVRESKIYSKSGNPNECMKSVQLYEKLKNPTETEKNNLLIAYFNTGILYDYSKAFTNILKAKKMYKKACDGGLAIGCYNLGNMYSTGDGVKQNKSTAMKLYKQACDGGYARGCFNLAHMYSNGDGVKQNNQTAAKLYKQACDGGYIKGCYNLGNQYYYGTGVRQNKSIAKELWGKACDGGFEKGCINYAIVQGEGY
ncbi:MAG: sel1 repeat family protein [Helicobacteraceae bacterium]|nr:sel1 repeat family protein [Helicobacteraceae bacterium]